MRLPFKMRPSFKPDKGWLTGLVFLLLSITLFITHQNRSDFLPDGVFLLHYALVLIYFTLLWSTRRLRRGSNSLPHIFLLLVLALISCYALNQTMQVFQPAATWWSILLVIACINYSTLFFFPRLPRLAQQVICFIAGISFLCFLYLALFLVPSYLTGIASAYAFGISLHLFVPALFVGYTIAFYLRITRQDKRLRWFFVAGLFLSLVFVTQLVIRWDLRVKAIDRSWTEAQTNHGNLPPWVLVAQACAPTSLDEQIIRCKMVRTGLPDQLPGWRPRFVLQEAPQHDPLLVIATLLCGNIHLQDDDRLKILHSVFATRYRTENRLWCGDDLVTTDVAALVWLWPQLHMSYTEEEIWVANRSDTTRWFTSSDEALYTFHLPEGAVVSALSLWIDGKEQKGIFTSRQKADSASTTVAGRFHRAPSVVHWQEGNTVLVRVFPVTTTGLCRFKLGITAPLEKKGKNLVYHSISFEGPPVKHAGSSISIIPMQRLIHPVWTGAFQSDSGNDLPTAPSRLAVSAAPLVTIHRDGDYTPEWSFQCEDPGIETVRFHFGGKLYTTATPTPVMIVPSFRQVYLDLNSAWTNEEYESLLASLVNIPVYVSPTGDTLVNVTAKNKQEVFDAAAKRPFSLFPISRIRDYEHSLFISKSTPRSPSLSDLDGSPFSMQLQEWLTRGGHVFMYNIGDEISPYLSTLREAGAFQYEQGDLYTLQSHLHHNAFPQTPLEANEVLIDPAGLLIRCIDDAGATSSSDPLLRLFAYRQMIRQLKGRLPASCNDTDSSSAAQLGMAEAAGIVSPVSSYVVPETKAGYDGKKRPFPISQ